jgi:hypothetical protein
VWCSPNTFGITTVNGHTVPATFARPTHPVADLSHERMALLHGWKTSFGMLVLMRRIRRVRLVLPPRSAFTGFRFPREVIALAVRWYLRYGLSYRDVEELLAERGIRPTTSSLVHTLRAHGQRTASSAGQDSG